MNQAKKRSMNPISINIDIQKSLTPIHFYKPIPFNSKIHFFDRFRKKNLFNKILIKQNTFRSKTKRGKQVYNLFAHKRSFSEYEHAKQNISKNNALFFNLKCNKKQIRSGQNVFDQSIILTNYFAKTFNFNKNKTTNLNETQSDYMNKNIRKISDGRIEESKRNRLKTTYEGMSRMKKRFNLNMLRNQNNIIENLMKILQ